jgi:LysM repeat protein
MGILKDIEGLFKSAPEATPNGEWPNENTPGYYQDDSVGENVVAGVTTEQWQPTYPQNIPYRGTEDHGVPFDASNYQIVPSAIGQADVKPEPLMEIVEVQPLSPIPVTVVEMPTSDNLSKRVATTQWTVASTDALAVKIVARHLQRTRTRVWCKNGTVLFGSTPSQVTLPVLGAAMPTTPFEINTTESLWAIGTGAADTIYVFEEYDSIANEKES